jgi:hypothetical protein
MDDALEDEEVVTIEEAEYPEETAAEEDDA